MQGTSLGPYRIERELGRGGMGTVFRATTLRRTGGLPSGTTVALKLVHPHLVGTEGFFKRFLREAEIGKSVRHENVVRTIDVDAIAVDGVQQNFLVMEYVEGQTLRGLLKELERVPEELCRHIGREVAKGLAAIHGAGVIHRDIKPENVIISTPPAAAPQGAPAGSISEDDATRVGAQIAPPAASHVVKVMDLGLARLSDEAFQLSAAGTFSGTIRYAAPECFGSGRVPGAGEAVSGSTLREGRSATADRVDHRADLHALGLVLYELSSGVNPYSAETIPGIVQRVLHEKVRRLGDLNPQVSPFFEEVVHCLLAKSPDDRFQGAAALLDVLEHGEGSAWWMSRTQAIRVETQRPLRRIRIPRETAVHGREGEIALLRACFARASQGEGQVVLLEGEAGIGKSRIVDELVGRLQRDGEDINFLFGSYPPGGAATTAGAFSTAFREHFGDSGLAESLRARLGAASALAASFSALLLGTTPPDGAPVLTKESLQTCFVAALRSLAAERTTVLLIDDLHFAPEEARSLFSSLAMAVPGHRVVLVGTTRPGVGEKWLAELTRVPQTTHIPLSRLGTKDLVQLLSDSLKSEELAVSLAGQIGMKSDGNPFFIFEIVRGLRAGQFLTQRDDGSWVSTRVIGEIKIPSSILDLVNARVADLTQEERDLLDMAACCGFEFDPSVIAEAVGEPLVPTLKRFATIEKRHRLVRASGRKLVFDHHQVQEALYESLYEQMREAYHAALGATIEARNKAGDKDPATLDGALCADLCEHFLKGAQGERALRYLAAANRHLGKRFLHDAAARLLERALDAPGLLTGVERARTLVMLSEPDSPLDRLGRRKRQEEAAREAGALAAAAGDMGLRDRSECALGTVFLTTGRSADAERVFRALLETTRARGDKSLEAAAVGNLGTVLQAQGRLTESEGLHEQQAALFRETGDRSSEARAIAGQAMTLSSLGRYHEAAKCAELSLSIAREIGDRLGEAIALGNLGITCQHLGRLAEARAHCERNLAIARETGYRWSEAHAAGNVANICFLQGRLDDAKGFAERQLAMARELGNPAIEAYAMGSLGNIALTRGRFDEAKQAHTRRLELARNAGNRVGQAVGLHNLGVVLREIGDNAASDEHFVASLALASAAGHRHLAAATHLTLGSLRAAVGDVESARAELTAARDLAAVVGAPGTEAIARCELALLPGGDPADALAAFREKQGGLSAEEVTEARFLLWRVTGDRAHLAEVKRLLDAWVSQMSAEDRASALANRSTNREILAACQAEGIA